MEWRSTHVLPGTAGVMLLLAIPVEADTYDALDVPIEVQSPVPAPWMAQPRMELVTNGSFETADLSGWDVDEWGVGQWFATNAGVGPLSGNPLQSPSDGTFQAVIDQKGRGRHILWQDVELPAQSKVTLRLVYWLENYNKDFYTPDTLDPEVFPNQQARIDIMDPAFPVTDVGAGVLQSVFITNPGSPSSVPPTALVADLSAFSGQTIRLRFAEVDNQFLFNFAVDAVSIDAVNIVSVEDRSWGSLKSLYR